MIKGKVYLLFVLLTTIALAVQIFNLEFVWGTLPLENHAWRNTQTLISVDSILKGLSPFDLQIMGAGVSTPMEFPLYQYVVYYIYLLFSGWSNEVDTILLTDIGRIVALISAIGIFTYPIAVKFKGDVFLAIFFSVLLTSLLIEYEYMSSVVTATLGDSLTALTYVIAIYFLRDIFSKEINSRDLAVGIVFLTIAAVSKVTTVFIFIIALPLFYSIQRFAHVITGLKSGQSIKNIIKTFEIDKLVLISIPLLAAYVFVIWGDSVKEVNYFGAMLTSNELRGWNMGNLTISDIPNRLSSLYNSQLVWIRTLIGILFISLILCIVIFKRKRLFYILLTLSALATLILFQNLYSHNYYILAIFPYLSVAIVDLSHYASKALIDNNLRNSIILLILTFVVVVVSISYEAVNSHAGKTSRQVFHHEYKDRFYQATLADYIKRNLDKDEIFVANGFAYSPVLPFISGRSSFMINDLTQIGYERKYHKKGSFIQLLKASSIKDPGLYVTCGKDNNIDSIKKSFILKEVFAIKDTEGCLIFKMQKK